MNYNKTIEPNGKNVKAWFWLHFYAFISFPRFSFAAYDSLLGMASVNEISSISDEKQKAAAFEVK